MASIGTAGGAATTLTAKSAVGDTNVKVASVSGATVGHQYRVGSPPNDEYPTVAAVGTASSTATTLAGPAAAGDTNIKVASITGFTVGQGAARRRAAERRVRDGGDRRYGGRHGHDARGSRSCD